MDQELEDILVKLTGAVEAMMRSTTPQQQRFEAYQVCLNDETVTVSQSQTQFQIMSVY